MHFSPYKFGKQIRSPTIKLQLFHFSPRSPPTVLRLSSPLSTCSLSPGPVRRVQELCLAVIIVLIEGTKPVRMESSRLSLSSSPSAERPRRSELLRGGLVSFPTAGKRDYSRLESDPEARAAARSRCVFLYKTTILQCGASTMQASTVARPNRFTFPVLLKCCVRLGALDEYHAAMYEVEVYPGEQ